MNNEKTTHLTTGRIMSGKRIGVAPKYTQEHYDKAANWLEHGYSKRSISMELGCTRVTLNRLLTRHA